MTDFVLTFLILAGVFYAGFKAGHRYKDLSELAEDVKSKVNKS